MAKQQTCIVKRTTSRVMVRFAMPARFDWKANVLASNKIFASNDRQLAFWDKQSIPRNVIKVSMATNQLRDLDN
jgi:hypothetical protein